MKIYAVKYPSHFPIEKFNFHLNLIEKERKAQIENCRSFKRASTMLLGNILIRDILKKDYNLKEEEIRIKRNEFGKPYLEGRKDIHFNISNSGEWVICGVDNKEIGVDIEKLEPIDFSVAKHCFSEEEYKDFLSKSEEEKLRSFYSFWTLKESYIKNVGKGLDIDLKSFSIIRKENEFKIKVNNKIEAFNFNQYKLDEDYSVSICSKNNKFIEDIIKKDFNFLYN